MGSNFLDDVCASRQHLPGCDGGWLPAHPDSRHAGGEGQACSSKSIDICGPGLYRFLIESVNNIWQRLTELIKQHFGALRFS